VYLRYVIGAMAWIAEVQERDRWWTLLNMVLSHRVNLGNFLISREPIIFSRRTPLHRVTR